MTNIAIENDHLIIVDLPIENGDFPLIILVYQRVNGLIFQACLIDGR
jgi:hypothetical protein